ncbi:hypothetical protein [Filomicrobium sp.]|uniref:hypothetical protein n=1 Tax=Filomicrobium sp. TaxID=2024831 RepID=UPI002588F7BE|nr:hypothetical protein [Filomicrobium sp.]MCV0371658.1 hypothetical protein [Filomicrobium sp.]
MDLIDINEPATVNFGSRTRDFTHVINAIKFAYEECQPEDRGNLVITMKSGRLLYWPEVNVLYRRHLAKSSWPSIVMH